MQDDGTSDNNLSDASFRKYVSTIERLIRSVEKRCKVTGEEPRLYMIAEQVAVRSRTIATSTMRFELSSCRTVLRQVLDERAWPASLKATSWINKAERIEIEQLLSAVSIEPKFITETANEVITRLMTLCDENDDSGEGAYDPDDKAARTAFTKQIASFVRATSKRIANQSYAAFSFSDWERIEMALNHNDPEKAVKDLIAKKVDVDGLLRLYSAMIFMSGMRPVEVMSCMLLVPDASKEFTPEDVALFYADPGAVVDRGLAITVEKYATQNGIDYSRAARNASDRTGAPCILVIRNAKRTNANPDLRDSVRMQIIDQATTRDLTLITYATQIRNAKLNERQWDTLRGGMLKRLKEIVDNEPAIKRKEVNLYSFRHAFADRARATYDKVEEVAALTGHTSRTTLSGYGEKKRKSGTSSAGGWVPKPDPMRVEEIRNIWYNSPISPTVEAPGHSKNR